MKTDAYAIKYLDGKHRQLQFSFRDMTMNLDPMISTAFKYYFSESKRLKTEE
jgi:hypothetical protein